MGFHGVDDPHHNAADEQRAAHDEEALQVLANNLRQKKCRNGGDDEGNNRQPKRMSKGSSVPVLTLRKSGEEFRDPGPEIDGQAQNRSQLDDDGVHLPIAVSQVDVEESFGDTQVGSGTHG